MTDPKDTEREHHGILEAFNAQGVVEHPGQPRLEFEPPPTPAAPATDSRAHLEGHHSLLEAFSAQGVVEHPGEPRQEFEVETPVADADVQAPG